MATFKVGQRVRLTPHPEAQPDLVGRTGVFLGYERCLHAGCMSCDSAVRFDGDTSEKRWGPSSTLAPLTDPGAEAFLERMRKLKPYDEPKVEPVRQGTPIWK